jgi:uncharacterized protein YjbJ (UPF0337 family)
MGIGNRIKGAAEELGGKVKEGFGNVTNDPHLVREGREDQRMGQDRQDYEKSQQQVEGFGEELKGRVKSTVGAATGDESTELSGKLDEMKGKARRKINE